MHARQFSMHGLVPVDDYTHAFACVLRDLTNPGVPHRDPVMALVQQSLMHAHIGTYTGGARSSFEALCVRADPTATTSFRVPVKGASRTSVWDAPGLVAHHPFVDAQFAAIAAVVMEVAECQPLCTKLLAYTSPLRRVPVVCPLQANDVASRVRRLSLVGAYAMSVCDQACMDADERASMRTRAVEACMTTEAVAHQSADQVEAAASALDIVRALSVMVSTWALQMANVCRLLYAVWSKARTRCTLDEALHRVRLVGVDPDAYIECVRALAVAWRRTGHVLVLARTRYATALRAPVADVMYRELSRWSVSCRVAHFHMAATFAANACHAAEAVHLLRCAEERIASTRRIRRSVFGESDADVTSGEDVRVDTGPLYAHGGELEEEELLFSDHARRGGGSMRRALRDTEDGTDETGAAYDVTVDPETAMPRGMAPCVTHLPLERALAADQVTLERAQLVVRSFTVTSAGPPLYRMLFAEDVAVVPVQSLSDDARFRAPDAAVSGYARPCDIAAIAAEHLRPLAFDAVRVAYVE
jgi:hypothetical protein